MTMKKHFLLWGACALLSSSLFSQELQQYEVTKISEQSHIRTDRRPVPVGYYDREYNKTFVTWMGAKSAALIKEYDHSTGTWSEDTVIGTSPFSDKHNYPTILRGKDGRLYVFFGCHNSPLKMAVSPTPGSIAGQWEERFIEEAIGASYPAPVITDDGTFYVFFRSTRKTNGYADDRPFMAVKSTDGGKTWTNQMISDHYPRPTDSMMEVYNGKVTYEPATENSKEKIHLAWTICGEKLGRHAHATYGRNIYYAYLDPSNDHLYNIHGEDMGKSLDAETADKHCLVWDTGIPERGHYAGLQISVHYMDGGFPIIHYSNQKENCASTAGWDGEKWNFTNFDRVGDPREIEKIGPRSFRIYRLAPGSQGIITYRTDNGGLSWSKDGEFHVGSVLARCFVIDNYHPDIKLLLTEDGPVDLQNPNRDVWVAKEIPAAAAMRE